MRHHLAIIFILVLFLTISESRQKLKGGKAKQRSKRTIGDIINWKLNIIQGIFGGLFGGKKTSGGGQRPSYGAPKPSYGAPKPSYGAPKPSYGAPKPKPSYGAPKPKPSYGAPKPKPKPSYGRPKPTYGAKKPIYGGKKPSYNNKKPKPVRPRKPSYGGRKPSKPSYGGGQVTRPNYGSGRPQSRPQGQNYGGGPQQQQQSQQQFGPSSVFVMLPAPNLATSAPQAAPAIGSSSALGSVVSNLGGDNLDSYGSPQELDSYGSPQAPPVVEDTYGSPLAPPVVEDTYGSPQASPVVSGGTALEVNDSFRQAKYVSLPAPAPSTAVVSNNNNVVTISSPAEEEDSYGTPVAPAIVSSVVVQDSYSAASPVSSVSNSFEASSVITSSSNEGSIATPADEPDSYGTPIAPPVVSSAAIVESYSSPASVSSNTEIETGFTITDNSVPIVNDNSVSYEAPESAPDSYGAALAPVITPTVVSTAPDSYIGASSPTLIPVEPVSDSYTDPIAPTVAVLDPESAPDAYGTAAAPLISATNENTEYDEYDQYDPNDIPADQAAPETLDTYGVPTTSLEPDLQEYASLDPIISDNSIPYELPQADPVPQQPLDIYGSELAPVGTSAPVPDDVFTVDSADSYNPVVQIEEEIQSEPVTKANINEDVVIDLTSKGEEAPFSEIISNDIEPIDDIEVTPIISNEVAPDTEYTAGVGELLPPVDVVDLRVDDETPTPTTSPVLFTYPPSEEYAGGTEADDDDLVPTINIVVQSNEVGSSPSDPLNVIPDEYETDYTNEEDDYDPNDVPDDQAAPEALDSYGNDIIASNDIVDSYISTDIEALDSYGNDIIANNEIINTYGSTDISTGFVGLPTIEDTPAPAPAFAEVDLRDTVEFTTGPAVRNDDPIPTTYSPAYDIISSDSGIEVVNVVTAIEEEPSYNNEGPQSLYVADITEEQSNYNPDIPIVVDDVKPTEAEDDDKLSTYDPVVLLVGTPSKTSSSSVTQPSDIIPLYENSLEEKPIKKRKTVKVGRKKTKKRLRNHLKDRYNNWYGRENDWSKRIQKVQGRIRFKNQ